MENSSIMEKVVVETVEMVLRKRMLWPPTVTGIDSIRIPGPVHMAVLKVAIPFPLASKNV
jgi:hypothetical protein